MTPVSTGLASTEVSTADVVLVSADFGVGFDGNVSDAIGRRERNVAGRRSSVDILIYVVGFGRIGLGRIGFGGW